MESQPVEVQAGHRGSRFLAFAVLAVLAVLWGYNWVVMKVALQYAEPFAFSAMRTFFAAVVLFAVLVIRKKPLRPHALPLVAALGLLQTAAFTGLAVWALKYAGAGKTSVLVYIMPFWLLLFAWVFLAERLRGLQWAAIFLAFCGLVFILSPWRLRGGVTGDLMAVGAGVAWAGSAVVAKLLHTRRTVDLLSVTAWQMLFGAIPLVVIAAVTTTQSPAWSGSFIAALLYNVLLVNAFGYYLWFFVLRVLPAGIAGLGSLVIPVVGVVSAWIQLGERPGLWEGLGILFIVGGLAVLTGRDLIRRLREGEVAADLEDTGENSDAGAPA
jgi:drug/metabolite transporter (DMT)-like permease